MFRITGRREPEPVPREEISDLTETFLIKRHENAVNRVIDRLKEEAERLGRRELAVLDVDMRGWIQSSEIFAGDRLASAIERIYERYAELLPAGRERERVAR